MNPLAFLLLAMMVCLEAEGEPFVGQVGVAYVALNRAEQWGQPLTQVLMAPNQFGGWRHVSRLERLDPKVWSECKRAAQAAGEQRVADPTSGAVHFLSEQDLKHPPAWLKIVQPTVKLGRHQFYR